MATSARRITSTSWRNGSSVYAESRCWIRLSPVRMISVSALMIPPVVVAPRGLRPPGSGPALFDQVDPGLADVAQARDEDGATAVADHHLHAHEMGNLEQMPADRRISVIAT